MLFEHFVILEIYRLLSYSEQFFRVFHWRSSHGAEVDLIVEKEDAVWAVEIKSVPLVRTGDLRGLKSFVEDYEGARPICISTADRPYMAGVLPVVPWQMAFGPEWLDLSLD